MKIRSRLLIVIIVAVVTVIAVSTATNFSNRPSAAPKPSACPRSAGLCVERNVTRIIDGDGWCRRDETTKSRPTMEGEEGSIWAEAQPLPFLACPFAFWV